MENLNYIYKKIQELFPNDDITQEIKEDGIYYYVEFKINNRYREYEIKKYIDSIDVKNIIDYIYKDIKRIKGDAI